MPEPWELIPAELVAMHDAFAGTSLTGLARILKRHEEIVRAQIADRIEAAPHPCREPDDAYCACADLQRKQDADIARGDDD